MAGLSLRRDDILIPQGSQFAVYWPSLTVDGVALDATGWTARAQVRADAKSATLLHEWTTANGGLTFSVVDALTRLTLTVDADDSSAWEWRLGSYDVEIVDPNGAPIRLTQGTIQVDPEVTRA
jgi:hypothetical protein